MINGLIPSKPDAIDKEDKGTTVLLFWGPNTGTVEDEQIIARGFADINGEFRAEVSQTDVGKTIICRYRHSAYKFADDEVLVMPYGAFHTAKMVPDFAYEYKGAIRGADVGNLKNYTDRSLETGHKYRNQAFSRLQKTGVRLGEVPFLYWFRYYFFGIAAFAADYYLLGHLFDRQLVGFVDPIYFSVVTITTLGYGEIVPTHGLTKILTSLQATSGVVLVGLFLNSLFANRN